jgi:glutaredoxin
MLELWQAEWCPHSHAVRQRLTELGLDVVARQVPADKDDRDEMERRTGCREIPTLVAESETLCGEDEILPWLDAFFEEREDAGAHRAKARDEVKLFGELVER